MRILVSSTPGIGHLLPLLPVAREARSRGHEVVIAGGASLAGIIEGAGFRHAEMGPATIGEVIATVPEIAGLTGRRRAVVTFREVFCKAIATQMAAGLDALVERWRPDVAVHEDMDFGASIVAERRAIPHVTVQATAWRPRMRDHSSGLLNGLRVRHGLAEDPGLRDLAGSIFFTTRPVSLRDPDAPMPDGSAELRPIADDRRSDDAGTDPFPRERTRPRVAATLGTVNAWQVDILRTMVEGAASAGADVVVALGADPATLGDVPGQVTVHAYVPMSRLLPAADLITFHGGSGTMLAALAAGVPMVIVPLGADQLDNADRCLAAGVARVVAIDELSASATRAAIEAVLADPAYGRRAREIAAEIAAMPGPDVAVGRLETLG